MGLMEKIQLNMVIYAALLGIYFLLLAAGHRRKIIRRAQEYFASEDTSGLTGAPVYHNFIFRHLFLLPAVFLYEQAGRSAAGRKKADSRISADLSNLYPQTQLRDRIDQYGIRKASYLLLLFLTGILLAAAVHSMQMQEGVFAGPQSLKRNAEGGADREVTLAAEPYGEFTFTLRSRRYTQEQCEEMAKEAGEVLESAIQGGNRDLQHVTEDLFLPKKLEGYPFSISWESSRYSLVDQDGRVYTENLGEGETAQVQLRAVLTYEEYRTELPFAVLLTAKEYTGEEKLDREISSALAWQEEQSLYSGEMPLPEDVDGHALVWTEAYEDQSMPILLLFLAAGAAWYVFSDRQLHQKVQERTRQMQLDYPGIISRIVLLTGAGMSIRNVFFKLADDYRRGLRAGKASRYVNEEILLLCNELESGIAEPDALTHFSRRCRSRQYTKLCSLLIRGRSKGSSTLLQELQEEAEYAYEARKSMARQLGEEAGTKLLLPMMLMLVVTLMMILLPAMSRFSI